MVNISPVAISINNPQVIPYTPVVPAYNTAAQSKIQPAGIVDLTEKYTNKEIDAILKRVGTDNKLGYPCQYSVEYLPQVEAMVINNKNMTNDTTEIYKDGRAVHCGSWHNKEVAPKGTFVDIVEDAKKRFEEIK